MNVKVTFCDKKHISVVEGKKDICYIRKGKSDVFYRNQHSFPGDSIGGSDGVLDEGEYESEIGKVAIRLCLWRDDCRLGMVTIDPVH